jgi:hypothetical protein
LVRCICGIKEHKWVTAVKLCSSCTMNSTLRYGCNTDLYTTIMFNNVHDLNGIWHTQCLFSEFACKWFSRVTSFFLLSRSAHLFLLLFSRSASDCHEWCFFFFFYFQDQEQHLTKLSNIKVTFQSLEHTAYNSSRQKVTHLIPTTVTNFKTE